MSTVLWCANCARLFIKNSCTLFSQQFGFTIELMFSEIWYINVNKVTTHTYDAPLLFFPGYGTPSGAISDHWQNSCFVHVICFGPLQTDPFWAQTPLNGKGDNCIDLAPVLEQNKRATGLKSTLKERTSWRWLDFLKKRWMDEATHLCQNWWMFLFYCTLCHLKLHTNRRNLCTKSN